MNWMDWTLVGWFVVGIFAAIYQIGKPRRPIDAGDAMLMTAVNAALIAGILVTHG